MSSRGSADSWSSSPSPRPPRQPWYRRMFVSALTVLIGVIIGGAVAIYLTSTHGPIRIGPDPTPTATVTATAPPAKAYVIPAECQRLLERSREVSQLLSSAATAAADVDAAKLSGIVRQAEALNAAMAAEDTSCRSGLRAP